MFTIWVPFRKSGFKRKLEAVMLIKKNNNWYFSSRAHFFTFSCQIMDFCKLINLPPHLPCTLQHSPRYAMKDHIAGMLFCSTDPGEVHFISNDWMWTFAQWKEEFPVRLPWVLWSVYFFTAEPIFLEMRFNKQGAKRATFQLHFKFWCHFFPWVSVSQATC